MWGKAPLSTLSSTSSCCHFITIPATDTAKGPPVGQLPSLKYYRLKALSTIFASQIRFSRISLDFACTEIILYRKQDSLSFFYISRESIALYGLRNKKTFSLPFNYTTIFSNVPELCEHFNSFAVKLFRAFSFGYLQFDFQIFHTAWYASLARAISLINRSLHIAISMNPG